MEPPMSLLPLPSMVTGYSSAVAPGSSSFSFPLRQLFQRAWSCEAVDAGALLGETAGDDMGQSQIDVVATEKDVFTDRDAFEGKIAGAVLDGDEGEVSGAAADIDDKDQVAGVTHSRQLGWRSIQA